MQHLLWRSHASIYEHQRTSLRQLVFLREADLKIQQAVTLHENEQPKLIKFTEFCPFAVGFSNPVLRAARNVSFVQNTRPFQVQFQPCDQPLVRVVVSHTRTRLDVTTAPGPRAARAETKASVTREPRGQTAIDQHTHSI